MEATSPCAGGPWCPGPGSSPRPTASSTLTTGRSWSPLGPGTQSIGHWRSPGQSLCMWCIMGKTSRSFQSQKRLYIHKCCPSICLSSKPLNILKSSSFIIHPSTFIILHHPSSSFIILHSSFLHFVTFKLFSLLVLH